MSETITNRSAAIRDYLERSGKDPDIARRYSIVAARFEQMRLENHLSRTTPGENAWFEELIRALKKLTLELQLPVLDETSDGVEGVTWHQGFLPLDPQRMVVKAWWQAADAW